MRVTPNTPVCPVCKGKFVKAVQAARCMRCGVTDEALARVRHAKQLRALRKLLWPAQLHPGGSAGRKRYKHGRKGVVRRG